MMGRLLVMLSVLLAAGCSAFGPLTVTAQTAPGAGGGSVSTEGGIGGTGYRDAPEGGDDGVGGTGISFGALKPDADQDEGVGGTGILGIISAFGSIVVNGVHIDYEADTPVSIDGEAGAPNDFGIGQLVAVEAEPMGERYQAHLVEIQHVVVGPVERVDTDARRFTVLGQIVVVSAGDRLPSSGEWVKVSGLRKPDGEVAATRIDPARPEGGGLVRGVVRAARDGTLSIGDLRLPSDVAGDAGLESGDGVVLRGAPAPGGIEIRDVTRGPREPFGGRMRDLLVEGYVVTPAGDAPYLAGYGWTLPGGAVRVPEENGSSPTILKGPWEDGKLHLRPVDRPERLDDVRPMPWRGNGARDNGVPDLLRGAPGGKRGGRSAIDPTSLPSLDQVQTAIENGVVPRGFIAGTRPLTADELGALMGMPDGGGISGRPDSPALSSGSAPAHIFKGASQSGVVAPAGRPSSLGLPAAGR